MENKWLKDALFSGMTSNAFKLGTVLSLGWFWQRVGGCHTVYRAQDGSFDDYAAVQAVMSIADSDVTLNGQGLPADTLWHYIRRQVSGCGLESGDSPPCLVVIDSAGDMLGNTPNPPSNVHIEPLADAKFRLRWRYTPLAEEIKPTGFRVYMDSGEGFDFETPDATLAYGHGGNGEFSWTSGGLVNGQRYKFVIRSYRTSAGESQNTDFVSGIADDVGPDAITGITATQEAL